MDSSLKTAIALMLGKYEGVFHEWDSREAKAFFADSGISKRNWRVFMRHVGMADGRAWTYREIADAEGNISHVRAWQIAKQTEKNIKRYVGKFKK